MDLGFCGEISPEIYYQCPYCRVRSYLRHFTLFRDGGGYIGFAWRLPRFYHEPGACYQTVVGGAGSHLSGGEKQRISIARAIMKDAPIIILDEATANIDPESEQELTSAIDALTKEKTILMIAHRLKTVRHADNILVIDSGKIVQSGTHEQLMQQGGIYRRFVEARELAVGWKV